MKTRDLTLGAMCCGLSVLFLYIASVIPTGRASVAFIATLMPAVACVESKNRITALVTGVSAGILAGILVPKSGLAGFITIFFCAVLCWYPWLKSVIESMNRLVTEWIIKLAYYIAVSFLIDFLAKKLGITGLKFSDFTVIVSVSVLVIYDILLSYVMSYYVQVISPKLKRH